MNRRKLFGLLGVSPVAIAGAAVAAATNGKDMQIAGGSGTTLGGAPSEGQPPLLSLLPSKPPKEVALPDGRLRIAGYTELDYSRALGFTVGADGNLWVRPKGKAWQRVLTG